ncbi:transcriptional regulator [Salinimicrobium oceani]|uniref:Transcriptional regulator n=1 Tax=Salinimicrobium oceani TaxID=2722702 RepID=A0ABX1CW30_9FLAO|nr:transcriptional regulator [Salinimicrobium oceani]NJW52474.1 transcriptional regulator [Salinimicrobium oceani]
MIAVITGDIINSRTEKPALWLPTLKKVLQHYGKSPEKWEIFRGDSFQLITAPKNAFLTAIHIKAAIKQNKDLDVRMGIGVGEQDHKADKISESNGTAFVRSGSSFEALKKQNLGIQTGKPQVDEPLNLMFSLALLTANTWSPTVAATILTFIEHPGKSQTEIGSILKRSQSSLSEALKRGGFEEIRNLDDFYRKQMSVL